MSPQEAKDYGLIDEVIVPKKKCNDKIVYYHLYYV